jgi:hypothetical protein
MLPSPAKKATSAHLSAAAPSPSKGSGVKPLSPSKKAMFQKSQETSSLKNHLAKRKSLPVITNIERVPDRERVDSIGKARLSQPAALPRAPLEIRSTELARPQPAERDTDSEPGEPEQEVTEGVGLQATERWVEETQDNSYTEEVRSSSFLTSNF